MVDYVDEYRKIFEGGEFLRRGEEITLDDYAAFDGGGARALIDSMLKELETRESATILDWGCGTSIQWHTQCLSKHSKSLMNILGPKVQGFYRYDPALKMYSAKPTCKYDLIICSDVLEHIADEKLDEFFFEINSYVKKGGVMFYAISTKPSGNSFSDGTNMHINIKSPEEWFSILRKNSTEKTTVVFNGKHNY